MKYEKELREIKQYNDLYKRAEENYIKTNNPIMLERYAKQSDRASEKEIKSWDRLVKKILKEKSFMSERQANEFIRERVDSL